MKNMKSDQKLKKRQAAQEILKKKLVNGGLVVLSSQSVNLTESALSCDNNYHCRSLLTNAACIAALCMIILISPALAPLSRRRQESSEHGGHRVL